jgi:basic membrane protein A
MGDATGKVAKENPTQQFGIVDSSIAGATNVFPMQFATEQAAFLAGYVAAGYSKTGKVATYGGLKIPPVTVFMDGFADGVQYYNKQKGKNVQVLGWDKAKQNGTFAENFGDQNKGKTITNSQVSQGADVIMPVAGPVGLGAAAAAQAAGDVKIIGVDADWYETAPEYSGLILTSVVKQIGQAVFDTVEQAADDGFSPEPYVGTLENGGVDIAPFHDFDAQIPEDLKTRVEELREQIISGELTVESPSAT